MKAKKLFKRLKKACKNEMHCCGGCPLWSCCPFMTEPVNFKNRQIKNLEYYLKGESNAKESNKETM